MYQHSGKGCMYEKKERKAPEELEVEKAQKLTSIRTKLNNQSYRISTGIDEGNRLMIAANSLVHNDEKEVLVKYKSRSFQYESGQLYFRSKCHRLTKFTLETVKNDRKVC